MQNWIVSEPHLTQNGVEWIGYLLAESFVTWPLRQISARS